MRDAQAFALGLLGVALLAAFSLGRVPSTDEALAKRLLLLHGHIDDPKIVHRTEDTLRVVTASGHFTFVQQPTCDEGPLCAVGLDLLCWQSS
ncbi:MAG: hypothetical protein AAGA54_22995 [Myxococcota bacterium]